MPSLDRRRKKWSRVVDRAILGALMTVAAVLVERRLRKVLGNAAEPEKPERTVELS